MLLSFLAKLQGNAAPLMRGVTVAEPPQDSLVD